MAVEKKGNTEADARLDVQAVIAGAQAEITAAVVAAARERIVNEIEWSLRSKVGTLVAEHVDAVIKPAVQEQLAAAHDELVRGAVEACVAASALMAEKLREAMVKKVTEAFSSSYKAERLIKDILS